MSAAITRDEAKRRQRARYWADPVKARAAAAERMRKHADKNRDRRNARLRAKYAANPEPFKKRSAITDAKRLEAKRAREQKYRSENRALLKARQEDYIAKNKEKVRAQRVTKNARRRKAEGTHTGDDIKALFAYQKGRCPICRDSIAKGFHIDHIMPLIRGGRNDRSNLQLLCPTCNLKKGPKDPVAFAQERGLLL